MSARTVAAARACVLLLVCANAAVASPQAPKQPSKWARESAEKTEQSLRERDRELLHPGGALDLVGAEQEANGFRARTPALERGTLTAARVDVDELYARRLAMYEERRTFHTPVGLARDDSNGAKASTPAPLEASDAELAPARSNTGVLLTLTVLATLAAVWLVQRAPFKRASASAPASH